jgi:hypothetical protein
MPPNNHPAALMASTLSDIITSVKGSRPTTTEGSSLAVGHVFSQMPIGLMVDPREYASPWSPVGGTPPADGTAPSSSSSSSDAARIKRAQEAAYNTCELVDKLILVTNDGRYSGWPLGRKLSTAYGQLLQALEAPPSPPRSATQKKAIAKATKVLFETDEDGLQMKSAAYRTYLRNANAYAFAKATYAQAAARAQADPLQADIWPMTSVMLQRSVDDAWDTWKSEGADRIEAALATVQSLGIPLEQGMIAKARKVFDAWQLGLAGVPAPVAYASVSPKSWADPERDDTGFAKLVLESSQYHSHYESHGLDVTTGSWSSDASHSSGEGGISIFGFGFAGGATAGNGSSASRTTTDSTKRFTFHNDAKNLRISLEYGLCEIRRPYALFDVLFLKNYWVKGNRAGAISDGTLEGQVSKAQPPFLPMIPTHFLVVRNVEISSTDWGNDGETLEHMFGENASENEYNTVSASGGAALAVGPLVLGGRGGHQESHFKGSSGSTSGHDFQSTYGSRFENGVLTIKGAQIVAWLSEIVPYGAPLDDPDLQVEDDTDTTPEPAVVGD